MTGILCALAGSNTPRLVGQVSPGSVSASSATSQNMTTNSTTASVVSGGTGPYTYSWSAISVTGMSGCAPTNPSSATTAFTCTGVAGFAGSAIGRCVITDTASGRTVVVNASITAMYTAIDTQTVTVGFFDPSGLGFGLAYGFTTGIGSISDGTFNPKGGAAIVSLYCDTSFGGNAVVFTLNGSQTNDGWNSVIISGTTYDRASASYTSGNPTSWAWNSATNPFGTSVGATVVATFT